MVVYEFIYFYSLFLYISATLIFISFFSSIAKLTAVSADIQDNSPKIKYFSNPNINVGLSSPYGLTILKKEKIPQRDNNFNNNSNQNQNQNTTPRAYDIPNNIPQNNLSNYDLTNSKKDADNSWNEITRSFSENQNNIQKNDLNMQSSQYRGSGGSYRNISSSSFSPNLKFPSSSSINKNLYVNNNKNEFSNSFYSPNEKDLSSVTNSKFKIYNVSPAMDAISPGK